MVILQMRTNLRTNQNMPNILAFFHAFMAKRLPEGAKYRTKRLGSATSGSTDMATSAGKWLIYELC